MTLLPFLILGTTFGTRLLGIAFGFGGLREGMQAARRIAVTLDEDELATGISDTASGGARSRARSPSRTSASVTAPGFRSFTTSH